MAKDKELANEVAQEEEILAKVDEEIEEPEDLDAAETKADGKLIVKEEIAEGHVSLHARGFSTQVLQR